MEANMGTKRVIVRAPSRFAKWEFDKILVNVQLRVPLIQKDSTNTKVISFKGSGVLLVTIYRDRV